MKYRAGSRRAKPDLRRGVRDAGDGEGELGKQGKHFCLNSIHDGPANSHKSGRKNLKMFLIPTNLGGKTSKYAESAQ